MRPLVIATAGHVHHGKSSFIEVACKGESHQTTNRLPEEIRRGLTLDLGFVHTPLLSFIDCPGHDSLVKHLIAGHRALDGACLIVALNEGIQEQTLEHARVLSWLGVQKIMVVLSKSDLVSPKEIEERSKEILNSIKTYFKSDTDFSSLIFSKNIEQNEIIKTLLSFFNSNLKSENHISFTSSNQPRLFIDRAFTLKGIGTVVTGTWSEGEVKKSDEGYLFTPGKALLQKIRVKALKSNHQTLEKINTLGRIAMVLDSANPAEIKRGSILIFSKNVPVLNSKYLISINGDKLTQKRITAIAQIGTLSLEGKLIQTHENWQLILSQPCPLQKNDPLIIRLPHRIVNYGHCVAGGKIIDVYKKKSSKLKSEIIVKTQPITKASALTINTKLAQEINSKKWEAQVSKECWEAAQILCKQKMAYYIKDDLFLSPENHDELLQWLKSHFAKKPQLTIDDARDFFKVGRKTFIKLLEYSDRNHWTFRKGDGRLPFKLGP